MQTDLQTEPINLLEYEALAPQFLSRMALDYYASGAGDEITLRTNRTAWETLALRPRACVDVSQRDLRTQVLGQPIGLPVLVAPMAFQCLAHPDGEVATARAAAALGTIAVLSTLSTKRLEEVAQSQPVPLRWFQLYVHRDRSLTQRLVERAEAAGFRALCLTVDAPLLGRRERDARNAFTLPAGMGLANLTGMAVPQAAAESGLFVYFAQQLDPGLTWRTLEWLRSITALPIVVKGILRADDAAHAVDHGAAAVIVSNHGGRQLDGALATAAALPDVVGAVAGRAEVLVDGGIRRGTDVLKALAMGARAVLVGRPVLWGLAVGGEAGARHVLELLRDELDLAMALSGAATIAALDPSLLVRGR